MKFALAGNPNSGKTTLFNYLTGSNQYVGNWPGVTVEKKEGRLKSDKDITITDLPGIYSLSPYTLEEVVARDYLIDDSPEGIINIVDGTNLQRNLYLSTQLMELSIPMVLAVNMSDVMKKEGYELDTKALSEKMNMPVVEISAANGQGIENVISAMKEAVIKKQKPTTFIYSDEVEGAIKEISNFVDSDKKRWLAVKLFEKDEKILEKLKLEGKKTEIDNIIKACESELDEDSESIITEERYGVIGSFIHGLYSRSTERKKNLSEKIDSIVLNRVLALPIFALIMFIVYYVSISTVGTGVTDFVNDQVFDEGWFLFGKGREAYTEAYDEFETAQEIKEGYEAKGATGEVEVSLHDEEGNVSESLLVDKNTYEKALKVEEPEASDYGTFINSLPNLIESGLDKIGVGEFLKSLILDGIVAGVGAVLGFLPQMFVLFLFLAILEGSGYMARIAFILDRVFRKFGLSGKSFIPMLIGTGCSVPGILATRTIESDRDRRMTITTTSFMPCSAKLPVIALLAGAVFAGSWWVAPSAYFLGIISIIISGIILKKTKMFAGDPAPFIMELPDYRFPTLKYVFSSAVERAGAFVKKAGTVILLSTIVIWFTSSYGFTHQGFGAVDMNDSILAVIGKSVAWIFKPLGWGTWQNTVATVSGLVAKENVVSAFGILYGAEQVAENGWQIWESVAASFTTVSAYSFLAFNLLCAPCFAAIGAIKREMGSSKWTLFTVSYLTIFAYAVSFVIYQLGTFFTGAGFTIGTLLAILISLATIYLIVKPSKEDEITKAKKQMA